MSDKKVFQPFVSPEIDMKEFTLKAVVVGCLMGSNLYPALVRLLKAADCRLVRQGKGSHEIWFSPKNNRTFTVPRNTQKQHTANSVLKDAGLKKAF